MTERNDFQKLKRTAFSAAEKGFSRHRAKFKAWGKLDPTDKKPKKAKYEQPPASEEDELQYIIRLLQGDERLGRKLMSMKKQFTDASYTELVAMEYLDRKQIQYIFQPYMFGGRSHGKGIPDFALIQGPYWNIWEIEGDYWHSAKFETKEDQRFQRNRLMNHSFNGMVVKAWVQCWESDIYRSRDDLFDKAVMGISLRPI